MIERILCTNPWTDSESICMGCQRNSELIEPSYLQDYAELGPRYQVPVDEDHCRNYITWGKRRNHECTLSDGYSCASACVQASVGTCQPRGRTTGWIYTKSTASGAKDERAGYRHGGGYYRIVTFYCILGSHWNGNLLVDAIAWTNHCNHVRVGKYQAPWYYYYLRPIAASGPGSVVIAVINGILNFIQTAWICNLKNAWQSPPLNGTWHQGRGMCTSTLSLIILVIPKVIYREVQDD